MRDDRFVGQPSDFVAEDKPQDHTKMSEAEKAFFLKQQQKK